MAGKNCDKLHDQQESDEEATEGVSACINTRVSDWALHLASSYDQIFAERIVAGVPEFFVVARSIGQSIWEE